VNSNRGTAVSAGVLFIVATGASLGGTALWGPVLSDSGYLTRLTADATQVTQGALLELIAAGACVAIALALYPVLKQWSSGLALGSVAFRTIEAAMYSIAVVSLLSLLGLSRLFTTSEATERAALPAIGDALLGVREQARSVGVLAFSLGALMYYWLFYRSGLPDPALALRLGYRWHRVVDNRLAARPVQPHDSDGVVCNPGRADCCARDGSGGLADSHRL
jgi:Domain of unknown function (DUF4386)